MPWEGGPRSELVELVRTGRLEPCRALDLGCGSGANAVFLAKHGFEVTGVDFAAAALDKADRLAKAAGVDVVWIRDGPPHDLRFAGDRAFQRQERPARRRWRLAQGYRTRQEQCRRSRKTGQGASPGGLRGPGSRALSAIHQGQSARGDVLHPFRRTL